VYERKLLTIKYGIPTHKRYVKGVCEIYAVCKSRCYMRNWVGGAVKLKIHGHKAGKHIFDTFLQRNLFAPFRDDKQYTTQVQAGS